MHNLTFGERLADLRASSKLSQRELAKALDLSQSTIKSYENGKIYPHMRVLLRMSEYFGVTLDYLCAITDFNSRPSKLNEHFVIYEGKHISVGALTELLTSLDEESKLEVYDVIQVFLKGGRINLIRDEPTK